MKTARAITVMGFITAFAVGIVVVLFLTSEDIMHHRNNFIRRFSDQVEKNYEIDLQLKGYYFAGESDDSIYLGNYDAPLYFASVDKKLKKLQPHVMQIDQMDLPYRSVEVRVRGSQIFLVDGTVPCVFRGELKSLKMKYVVRPDKTFSHVVVIDSVNIAYRTHNKDGESILGLSKLDGRNKINQRLLQKQIDGNFDVDGSLYYDAELKKLVYVYLYRNQYIIANPDLSLDSRGNTIDTVSKAKIKVSYIKSHNAKKMSAPPLSINRTAAVYNGLLFVNSELIGKYEDEKIWKQASIIDVYSITDRSYISSLYIYNIKKKKLRAMYASGNNLYAIIGHTLVSYKLTDLITKHYAVK
ncbi:hypothetical protein D0817_10635 [Flavobacterium cupreum]|uniref:Uncharacterized protein n=1 Tax=Flavobacterium cupreum TaxID=2133766 RepID=A0A434A778_9FLAO|nr:hypothetical protein [Flavobacterium cupreum]RUT70268.1 hypothetical protein D0817_10635 [Flavobacterium cupreum]